MSDLLHDAYAPEAFLVKGHALLDLLGQYLAEARSGLSMPVMNPVAPESATSAWELPESPEGGADPIALLGKILAQANHLHHPGYLGHQVAAPLPLAALTDLVMALLNNSSAVYEMGPVAMPVERAVVQWMARKLGLPDTAGGVFTSGGSLGNLTALLAARQAHALPGDPRPPAFLVSGEAHYCIGRALRTMGLGEASCVSVPVDAAGRLRPEALPRALETAEQSGARPIGVVASACTTATGVYDPLEDVADFCAAHGLWMHVDAAHGGAACLSARYRRLVRGIERADSVVWDAHKMLMMPSLATAVLFQRENDGYLAFEEEASYLFTGQRREEWFNLGHRTLECTKHSGALKLYVALQTHGEALFTHYIDQTHDLAREFAAMLDDASDFECAVPPESNIVCFRYLPPGVNDPDALQAAVRQRVIASGSFYLVQTRLRGVFYLRTALMNPHTTRDTLVALLAAIREASGAILPAARTGLDRVP
jgi:L-2,4-diaminobutyrate decarboxylase